MGLYLSSRKQHLLGQSRPIIGPLPTCGGPAMGSATTLMPTWALQLSKHVPFLCQFWPSTGIQE